MKFYLIDDDASVCNILKIIIQQKKLARCAAVPPMEWMRWRTCALSTRILSLWIC